MKRQGNLYHKIYSFDNVRKAHVNARKGKAHYFDVQMVDAEPLRYIDQVCEMLKYKTYKVGDYEIFTRRVDSGKIRTIYRLGYFPHRIIHHAILQVIEPIWMSHFIADTYCCIKGRGIHKALRKIKRVMRNEKPEYCLKIDIKKFYPSCDNNVMKQMIRRKFKDKDLLWLLDEIIDSADGLPIGNYMSQYLANVYLTPFDWFCKQDLRIKHYFRYCDDIVILSDSKEELRTWFAKIKEYLANIKLEVKENWQIFPTNDRGVDFLGYRFFHNYTLLRKRTSKRILKKARSIRLKGHASLSDLRSLMSYHGWMIHADTYNLRKTIYDKEIRRHVADAAKNNNIKNPLRGRR